MEPVSSRYLDERPKCPSCGSIIVWGVTTIPDKDSNSEICGICKSVVAKK